MATPKDPNDAGTLAPVRTVNPLSRPAPSPRPRRLSPHSQSQREEAFACLHDPDFRESPEARRLRRLVLEAQDPARVDAITGRPKGVTST